MKSILIVAATIALTAGLSQAAYMEYDGEGLHATVKIHAPGTTAHNLTIEAGQMLGSLDGTDFVGYCVDLNQYAGSGHVVVHDYTTLNNGWMVAWLMETYAPVVTTGVQAAGLQSAIWEVIVEGSANLDVTIGNFKVKDNSAVANAANAMLAGLPQSNDPLVDPLVLYSTSKQDLIIPGGTGGVPEPASMSLLVIGAAGMLWRRRK